MLQPGRLLIAGACLLLGCTTRRDAPTATPRLELLGHCKFASCWPAPEGPPANVVSICFGANSELFVAFFYRGVAQFEIGPSNELRYSRMAFDSDEHESEAPLVVDVSRSGKLCAIGTVLGNIYVIDAQSGKQIKVISPLVVGDAARRRAISYLRWLGESALIYRNEAGDIGRVGLADEKVAWRLFDQHGRYPYLQRAGGAVLLPRNGLGKSQLIGLERGETLWEDGSAGDQRGDVCYGATDEMSSRWIEMSRNNGRGWCGSVGGPRYAVSGREVCGGVVWVPGTTCAFAMSESEVIVIDSSSGAIAQRIRSEEPLEGSDYGSDLSIALGRKGALLAVVERNGVALFQVGRGD